MGVAESEPNQRSFTEAPGGERSGAILSRQVSLAKRSTEDAEKNLFMGSSLLLAQGADGSAHFRFPNSPLPQKPGRVLWSAPDPLTPTL